jgi:hypothetical protein
MYTDGNVDTQTPYILKMAQLAHQLGHRSARPGVKPLVKSGTGQQTSREKKVVLLRELHRAVIYTTEMTKQVTKSHVRDAVHGVP